MMDMEYAAYLAKTESEFINRLASLRRVAA